MSFEDLLSAYEHPAAIAEQAAARRNVLFGAKIRLRRADPIPAPNVAALVRQGACQVLQAWPDSAELREGDRLLVQIDPTPEARERYVGWLREIAEANVHWSLAPLSHEAAGVHRLWCIAAARLSLPANVHIEVRHDLVGLRLAQLALGFGADTLSGPIEAERKLPLAGVPRPTESTTTALSMLVRQTGLEPEASPF